MGQILPQSNSSVHKDASLSTSRSASSSQLQLATRPKTSGKFLKSTAKHYEDDMITGCRFFQVKGFKPVQNLPIQEVCFGISEILSFVDCVAGNNARMKNLKKLSMHWNILSYQDLETDFGKLQSQVEKLGHFLGKIKSLEHIVFRISRNQPKSLLSAFKKVARGKQMKRLGFELQASKFQKSDIVRITKLLKEAINLQELSLSFKRCLVSDDAFEELFECLCGLSNLRRLKINLVFTANAVEYQIEQMMKIPGKLPKLQGLWVNVSGNDIEERYVKMMLEEFCKYEGTSQIDDKTGMCRRISFFVNPNGKNKK